MTYLQNRDKRDDVLRSGKHNKGRATLVGMLGSQGASAPRGNATSLDTQRPCRDAAVGRSRTPRGATLVVFGSPSAATPLSAAPVHAIKY